MNRRDTPLGRHSDEGILAGVCAGLAEYFDVDTILVRAAFLAAATVGGFGVALYIALWILVDDSPSEPPPTDPIDLDQDQRVVSTAAADESAPMNVTPATPERAPEADPNQPATP